MKVNSLMMGSANGVEYLFFTRMCGVSFRQTPRMVFILYPQKENKKLLLYWWNFHLVIEESLINSYIIIPLNIPLINLLIMFSHLLEHNYWQIFWQSRIVISNQAKFPWPFFFFFSIYQWNFHWKSADNVDGKFFIGNFCPLFVDFW